jgi:hypothetical protein
VRRDNVRLNLAFARGPHFCPGAHLARLEARAAVSAVLSRLPGLRLASAHGGPAQGGPAGGPLAQGGPAGGPSAGGVTAGPRSCGDASVRGLVFRKPPTLYARWDVRTQSR